MMRAAVAVLLCVCASVEGWTSGDFVPITVRSRFGTEETSPRDLGHDLSPRFGKNKGVHVKSLSHASIGGGDFKVYATVLYRTRPQCAPTTPFQNHNTQSV